MSYKDTLVLYTEADLFYAINTARWVGFIAGVLGTFVVEVIVLYFAGIL